MRSQKKVNVYADGWQCRLKALSKVVTDSFVTRASTAKAASDVPTASTSEIQAGNGSYVNAGDEFQFNAKPDFPGDGTKSTELLHHRFAW